MINKTVLNVIRAHQARFLEARPFRHVVIENFLENGAAEQLLQDFPAPEKSTSFVEMGRRIGKNVVENVSEISPFYKSFHDYIHSPAFLDAIGTITGIPDLISDNSMFGGGTHENVNLSELTPHVDFNFDISGRLHRRLNLLLYLNKEWEEHWGGSIEIHSDPRSPETNTVNSFLPLFNRCVIFETNEYSWHGFCQINLPEDKRHLSRKSFSLYLYTKERPAGEIAPLHTTVYVPRPLPSHIQPGTTLSAADFNAIDGLLERRDRLIRFYQEKELANSREEKNRLEYLNRLESLNRLPLTGYALQQGPVRGFWPDGWVSKELEFRVWLDRDISRFAVMGDVPGFGSRENEVIVRINGTPHSFTIRSGARFSLQGSVRGKMGTTLDVSISAKATMSPLRAEAGPDAREFAYFLQQLRFD